MGISFNQPLWWLLLPGLAFLIWYWRRPWLHQGRAGGLPAYRREKRRLAARLLLALLLVAVLAGPRWISTVDHQAVVFALDASASLGPAIAEGEAWLRRALDAKPARDLAGVVAFGEEALVEVPVTADPTFRRQETAPGSAGSNIAAALDLARGLLPAAARPRVVLLSDGRDTSEAAVTAARRLAQAGIRLDVIPAGRPAAADLRLDGIELPRRAYAGEKSTLQVAVTASQAASATLVIERDGELVASREVAFQAGPNRLALPLDAGPAGLHRYRVRLAAAAGDSITANNEAGVIQEVLGPPRVLLVAAAGREAEPLRQALQAAGQVEVEITTPAGVPADVAGLARYSAVFLLNVPAYTLGKKTMEQLETYVRDGGGGLVMTGGPDAFGPGGYAGTPVEKALPVQMDISGRGEQPSLGLMLVIDKSGSMDGYAGGARKIDLAKEAAARAAAILTERDQVGVVAFDSAPWWAVPLSPAGDQEALRQQIGSIDDGGGTEIYPALATAYQALTSAPTRVKHIILLTDGMSAQGGPYLELTRALAAAGITLTTVAVGDDADAGMLQALAELGRGRFYATADAAAVPSIFTRETVLATRSYAVNEHFYPRAAAHGPLLTGIQEVPPLDGYITATPKPLAEVGLLSPRGDPVLAAWQYGLGRAVAWTPDVAGRWNSSWLAGPVFPRLAGNILSWLLPADHQGAVQVTARFQEDGNGRQVIIDVDDPGQWQQVVNYQARIVAPGGETVDVALQPAGPGRYTGRLAVRETGAYVVNVVRSSSGGAAGEPAGEGASQDSGANMNDSGSRIGNGQPEAGAASAVEVTADPLAGPQGNAGQFTDTALQATETGTGTGGQAAGTTAAAGMVARTGVVVPYPAEYHQAGVDLESLQAIARAGGGTILNRPEEAFAPNLPPVRASRAMDWLLLLLAGILWLLDIAQRRLVWSREEQAEVLQAWRAALAACGRRLPRPRLLAPGGTGGPAGDASYLKVRPWGRRWPVSQQVEFRAAGREIPDGRTGREAGDAALLSGRRVASQEGNSRAIGVATGRDTGAEQAAPGSRIKENPQGSGREQGRPRETGTTGGPDAGASRTKESGTVAAPGNIYGRNGKSFASSKKSGEVAGLSADLTGRAGATGAANRDPGQTAARLLAAKRSRRG